MVVFNSGEIDIATNGLVYVEGSVVHAENPTVNLNGNFILTGDFINNISQGNIFSSVSSGTVLFKGSQKQYILGTAAKDTNYIQFPKIVIDKSNKYVEVDAKMGADITLLKLKKGKLVLKSIFNDNNERETTTHNSFIRGQNAHLPVNQVTYNRFSATYQSKGVVEVEMFISQKDKTGLNTMFGFTVPFKIYILIIFMLLI